MATQVQFNVQREPVGLKVDIPERNLNSTAQVLSRLVSDEARLHLLRPGH
jgi:hypothetical protein